MRLPALLACVLLAPAPAVAQVPDALKDKVAVCAKCHTETGNSVDPKYPKLAGQLARYLFIQLRDFKAGRRHDPDMDEVVQGLTPDDMLALADYFSKQKEVRSRFEADPQKVALGKQKADETLCSMCHLGGFSGQNEIPRVAGQHYEYIKKQLADFKARHRTNDAGNMTSVASTLAEEDIENLAQYITSLY